MRGEPFVLDSFVVITDEELMRDIAERAASGDVEAQKIQCGLACWTLRYKEGVASCICCSNPILDHMNIGAYFVCFSKHEDHGFASAFCFDCGTKHHDLDAFVASGVKGLRDLGLVMIPLGIAGRA
jgi:hypothetical protein